MMGSDASRQSGDAQDIMLHETAVALLRRRLGLSLPAKPWLETRKAYGSRLKAQAAYVNENYNLEGLCKQSPKRLEIAIANEGGRIWT